MDYCDPCPVGHECLGDGNIGTTPCEPGYYRGEEDMDSIECLPCPDGTYSNVTALATKDGCIECRAGWVCGTWINCAS